MANGDFSTIMINIITIVPPTLAALAAFRATQTVKARVGEPDGEGTIAIATADTQSSLLLATRILDRMDQRLDAVEDRQKTHEALHRQKPDT